MLSRVTLAVVVGSSLFSGCGNAGGSESSQPASDPPIRQTVPKIVSFDQFVKKASAICDMANAQRSKELLAFLTRRSQQAKGSVGPVGQFEMVSEVIAPSLRREIGQLEQSGLPKRNVYEAEAIWQTLRIVLHEVETEGLYAWRSAKLLVPFRNRAKIFGLEYCVIN